MYADEIDVAKEAARKAGAEMQRIARDGKNVRKKDGKTHGGSILTDADIAAQDAVIETVRSTFPYDDFFAEEEHVRPDSEERVWIIDPVDGTANYARDYPGFCVSIALREEGEYVAGVVYDPLRDVMYTAGKGEGAFANGNRLHVSDISTLREAVVAPYSRAARRRLDSYTGSFRKIGAAALDGSLVAAGALDAYIDLYPKEWDVAAIRLLITEAGGTVHVEDVDEIRRIFVGTNAQLHDDIMEKLGDLVEC